MKQEATLVDGRVLPHSVLWAIPKVRTGGRQDAPLLGGVGFWERQQGLPCLITGWERGRESLAGVGRSVRLRAALLGRRRHPAPANHICGRRRTVDVRTYPCGAPGAERWLNCLGRDQLLELLAPVTEEGAGHTLIQSKNESPWRRSRIKSVRLDLPFRFLAAVFRQP